MVIQVYTLRHGETGTNANKPGTFDMDDPSLTNVGLLQIRRVGPVAARLGIGLIISSTSTRAVQSTRELVAHLPYSTPVIYDHRAREQEWGGLKGRNKAEFFKKIDSQAQAEGLAFRGDPGAESVQDVADRMLSLVIECKRYDRGNVVIVTHNQTSKAPSAVVQDVDRKAYLKCDVPNGSLARLDFADPQIRTPLFVP